MDRLKHLVGIPTVLFRVCALMGIVLLLFITFWTERALEEEGKQQAEDAWRNSTHPLNSLSPGKTFQSYGRKWLVGAHSVTWRDAQTWATSLGGGWRLPSRRDLAALHNEIGNSTVRCFVWSESQDAENAWAFDFYWGTEQVHAHGWRIPPLWAVAVHSI